MSYARAHAICTVIPFCMTKDYHCFSLPAPLRSVVDVYGVVAVVAAGGDGEGAVDVAQCGAPLALLGQAPHPPPRVPGGPANSKC